jgi:hypothetical protein
MEGLAAGADAHTTAVDLARLPDGIRGYEDIKLRSIAKVRGQALTLMTGDSARDSTNRSP